MNKINLVKNTVINTDVYIFSKKRSFINLIIKYYKRFEHDILDILFINIIYFA